MKFETNLFFYLFLKRFQPDLVCDVGSCDGHNSLMCRTFTPKARIIAFEANPDNYEGMCADKILQQNHIEVVPKAVSNETGSLVFYVLAPAEGKEHAWRKGSSSLYQRPDGLPTKPVSVEAVRLDKFISNLLPVPQGVALWIDVEGAAYKVLEGMEKIAGCVQIVSVEVEAKECWPGQKLAQDVHALMKRFGFRYVGRGLGYQEIQYDALYVHEQVYSHHRWEIRWLLLQAVVLTAVKHLAGGFYAGIKHRFLSR